MSVRVSSIACPVTRGMVPYSFMFFILLFPDLFSPVCCDFAWEAGPCGKKSLFSCLLHDWILYSMGTAIPLIHLVSFFLLEFPCVIIFSLCLAYLTTSSPLQLEICRNQGSMPGGFGLGSGV